MLFSKETLKAFAQSKGITNVDDDALRILAQDLEYRIKEVCQEAGKFMLCSRRTKLSIDDVNYALQSRNVEPLYGYDPQDSLVFKNIPSNIYYVPDEELDLEEFLNRPLPKIPLPTSLHSHWLAIEGVQPQIPQNPLPLEKPIIKKDLLMSYQEEAELKSQNKHVLSKELQLYFDKIILFMQGTDSEREIAFECMEKESGIQQLIPYFIQNFSEFIIKNIFNAKNLTTVIKMYESLLKNQFIFIDPYLHQILPAILTCVTGKSIENDTIRISASNVVKYVYNRFSSSYNTLAPRVLNTLTRTWLDKSKNENSQYGALYCLSILSDNILETVILKNLEKYKSEINNRKVIDLLDELVKKYKGNDL